MPVWIQLNVAPLAPLAIICSPRKRGCSSVVEHLLAKEDVASSSLVTRSMPSFDITPSRDEFRELAKRGNLIPLIVDLVADVETPVSAFAKIDQSGPCFLFESAERNEESIRSCFSTAPIAKAIH